MQSFSFRSLVAVAIAATFAVCGVPCAARADAPSGQTVDGIHCDAMEGAVFHIHQHLALYDRGRPVSIPDDVGRPVLGNCLYWIHTHTPDGLIHVEAPVFRSFRLGDFFDVWGEPLSAIAAGPARFKRGALRAYVDGVRYTGDPRAIELTQHADITLEAGPPYRTPAPFTNWQGQ